jgi:hypothetical protein
MLFAGAFAFGAVLIMQGSVALLLPKRLILRFSGYFQFAAVCVIIGGYFMQPGFYGLNELVIPSMGRFIQWLPSHWFLALYQQLNGSLHPALKPLAARAWIALGVVFCCTPLVYALSYRRLLRVIVEQPDVAPAPPRWHRAFVDRLFVSSNRPQQAVTRFSVSTLLRSRQHRLILSFYLGIGLAFTSLILKGSGLWTNGTGHSVRAECMLLWGASSMVMALAIIGTRVAFGMPFDLRANWIFRAVGLESKLDNIAAARRAMYLIAVAPVWFATALACLTLWPSRQTVGHLSALALLAIMITDICLLRFRKIPFTCSWLPGKSQINMAFLAAIASLIGARYAFEFERRVLQDTGSSLLMLAVLALASICLRRVVISNARRKDSLLRFEEEPAPQLITLRLDQE